MSFKSPVSVNRRRLLQGGAGMAAALGTAALPRPARAEASERRFLFVFVNGGWDLTWGLLPMFDNPRVDCPDEGSSSATAGDIIYVDGPGRPDVRRFFQRWGNQTCMLHGFEVRSVAHFNCRRLVFTGENGAFSDDWPTLIAANGAGPGTTMPHLIVSGPGFAANYPELVGRVGTDGQLGAMLNLDMLSRRDVPLAPLQDSSRSAVASYLAQRAAGLQAAASTSGQTDLLQQLSAIRDNVPHLEAAFADTTIRTAETFPQQLMLACDVLERGVSRCCVVRHNGFRNTTWDSHGGIEGQVLHYQDLFSGLLTLMDELDSRPGLFGGSLLMDTTVVVVSEMSRHPKLNGSRGKDHWPWTSAMLMGSGVAGGRMVGRYDDDVFGIYIDPETGEESASGLRMQSRHFGATLLDLAGIDPTPYFAQETPPIRAVKL